MMLTPVDLLLILATAAVCTAAITLLALLVLRRRRQRSVTAPFVVLVVAAIASIVCSTLVIAALMYLSLHDLQVLLWVVGLSAVLSLTTILLTARAVSRSFTHLGDAVERVGRGAVVSPEAYAARELADLSTQLAVASERLAAARAEIEQLDAARRQFFAWISHDLRTPLTGVSALAEALDDGAVADPADYVRRIRVQVATMNRLVDDLFELSQIQSGALRLRREDVALLDVVSDAVADVHQLAVAKQIGIEHAGVAGRTVRADPHELTRVVVNLLTNSIRHAPAGSEVLVSAEQRGDRLVLSVLDQGSGVDGEDLTRMFEIGWRASAARTPDAGVPSGSPAAGSPGAGLGLAIVRGIVEAHGGDVRAAHVPQGFRLDVTLPASAT
ncbi:HAMP domain-containing sensor histidine kinase [Promicromonospora sp. MEB111]|uniref:sensor histidine kinase n=1 Tax=Promicromonospora sp. MEB111 TaxID=3040301 RepID=UPI00254B21B3|nr:HAMP domain-containing sensor histidine kinase [Promicromonospora sp. MEB111]